LVAVEVDHAVAVRADRPQVFDRIDHVDLADPADRLDVTDVDQPSSDLPVDLPEVEPADDAPGPVVLDAPPPGFRFPPRPRCCGKSWDDVKRQFFWVNNSVIENCPAVYFYSG
jgi:hypothetical protein